MAEYREGRRTSVAWEHFEIKDKVKCIATCNHCHQSFSYRTSVSNLMKHLRSRHSYDKDDQENEEDQKPEEKKELKDVWQYYEEKDEYMKLVNCNICNEPVSYEDLSVLGKHLKEKHEISLSLDGDQTDAESEDEKIDFGVNGNDKTESRRRNSSAAWEYFEIKDAVKKLAVCTVCGAQCSYKASVSNLTKHARRKHGLGPGSRSLKSDDETSEGEQNSSTSGMPGKRAQRSIVWLYFKCVDRDSKYSQCLICKKILSHATTLTNLKKHLSRRHPDVKIPEREDGRKRILLSANGELYEVETGSKIDEDDVGNDDDQDDQTVEMDTVFLEDFDSLETPAKKKRRLRKSIQPTDDSSSEEEITFSSKYTKKKNDALDHFGKYLVSLLRKLPPDVSNNLQAEFVRQTMAAQTSDVTVAAIDKYSPDTSIYETKKIDL